MRRGRGEVSPSRRVDQHVNLLDLDLNLLVALDALLTERSVTRAAEVLHRSQPALSASLKRLRRQFGDDLLVRVGNGHELTPLAAQLKSRVSMVLADIERVFASRARFDAAASTREFVILTSDYGQTMLGRFVATQLAHEAPGVRVRFRPLSDGAITEAEDSLRAVDGFILPHGFVHDLPHLDAYTDRWVILADRDNTAIGATVRLDELSTVDWVLPFHRQGSHVPAVRQLQLLGVDLHVAVAVEGFVSLPLFVAGTRARHDDPGAPRGAHRAGRPVPRGRVPVRGGAARRGAVVAPCARARSRTRVVPGGRRACGSSVGGSSTHLMPLIRSCNCADDPAVATVDQRTRNGEGHHVLVLPGQLRLEPVGLHRARERRPDRRDRRDVRATSRRCTTW